jgi:hypothetical protein
MKTFNRVDFLSKDSQKVYNEFAEVFNMHHMTMEDLDYSENIVRKLPGCGYVRKTLKENQKPENKQNQQIRGLRQMLRSACELAGVDNPFVLRKKSVYAFDLGLVPSDGKANPGVLSVELKSD